MTEETTIRKPMKVDEEIKPTGDGARVERQVQCADCLAWLKSDMNHTCRQQVRRNQKRTK